MKSGKAAKVLSMKYCILLVMLLFSGISVAQPVFAAGASGNMYRIELSNCSVDTVGKTNIFSDIALDPIEKELYGINVKGLYIVDTLTGKDSLIASTVGVNALTFDRKGNLFGASGGNIYTINKKTGAFKKLGSINGYTSAGDLTFFQGHLYLTVLKNELIRIDLDDISNSTPLGGVSGVRSGVFHGVTAVGCKNLYGFANKDIYEIRPSNLRYAHSHCPLVVDDYIYGAASYQEAGLPDFSLGKDSFLCVGDTVKYSFDNPIAKYTWQDTLESPDFEITQPGTYWVDINYTKCNFKDTVSLSFGSTPQIDLGPDTLLCPTHELRLNAYWPGSTYKWQDGSVSSEFEVTQPGTHWVIAKSGTCGSDTDSVVVQFRNELDPDLGPDRNLCDDEEIVLKSNMASDIQVRWQDGSKRDSFIVRDVGTYWLKGIVGNCAFVDTMRVVNKGSSPNIDLGGDTSLCFGNSLLLNANTTIKNIEWSTGSTQAQIEIDSAGTYWLRATSKYCGTEIDSIQLSFLPDMSPSFSGDTILCDDDTLKLFVDVPGSLVRWEGTVRSNKYSVTEPGIYTVKVRLAQCVHDDTISVKYHTSLVFDLGPDTVFCQKQSHTLKIDAYANRGYLWSTGQTSQEIPLDTSGTYWGIARSNYCGEMADTVTISFVDPYVPSLGLDTVLCENDSFHLIIDTEYDSIVWSEGSRSNLIFPKQNDFYSATVFREGCMYTSDTVSVTLYDCNCPVRISNMFTPNGDGYNDGFKPEHDCYLTYYHFQIFNRWGQLVFESEDPEASWQGSESGSPSTYFYLLRYRQFDNQLRERKGTITQAY